MVHIYAGNLLMTTGSYEDATKAFTNADTIDIQWYSPDNQVFFYLKL